MTNINRHILNFLYFILSVIGVQCNTVSFRSQFFEFDDVKSDIIALNKINISSIISEFTSHHDWMANRNCLIELNAIRNGFENYEEWAFKCKFVYKIKPFIHASLWFRNLISGRCVGKTSISINAWELLWFWIIFAMLSNSTQWNRFQDKILYWTTQILCRRTDAKEQSVATVSELSPFSNITLLSHWNQFYVRKISFYSTLIRYRLDVGPGVSIGLCLPMACSINHLETIANSVLTHAKVKNMTVKIRENSCQIEETASHFNSIDFAAMWVFINKINWLL